MQVYFAVYIVKELLQADVLEFNALFSLLSLLSLMSTLMRTCRICYCRIQCWWRRELWGSTRFKHSWRSWHSQYFKCRCTRIVGISSQSGSKLNKYATIQLGRTCMLIIDRQELTMNADLLVTFNHSNYLHLYCSYRPMCTSSMWCQCQLYKRRCKWWFYLFLHFPLFWKWNSLYW